MGQLVIMRQLLVRDPGERDTGDVPLVTHLLWSGSNRSGSLDFQRSPSEYAPPVHDAPLKDLMRAADAVFTGGDLDPYLAEVARLTNAERDQLWGNQILNPFAAYGYDDSGP